MHANMRADGEALAIGTVTTWVGTTRVTATARGVRDVWLPRWDAPRERPAAPQPGEIAVQRGDVPAAEAHLRRALAELAEFFAGERRAFDVPLDPRGPDFFARIWREVAAIPYGETRTYGEIARLVGVPAAARAVGAANGANPVAPFVPCHRVLGSDGRLTGYGPGLPFKHALLIMEGAMPAGPKDYAAWVGRVSGRLRAEGRDEWFLGIRRLGVYCRPDCPRGGSHLLAPNRLLRDHDEAARAGFRPCPTCRPDAVTLFPVATSSTAAPA